MTREQSHEAAFETAEVHNDNLHDGERVARPVRPTEKSLNAFMAGVKRKYGQDVYGTIGATIVDADPFEVLP